MSICYGASEHERLFTLTEVFYFSYAWKELISSGVINWRNQSRLDLRKQTYNLKLKKKLKNMCELTLHSLQSRTNSTMQQSKLNDELFRSVIKIKCRKLPYGLAGSA